jgi:hypothetical protein
MIGLVGVSGGALGAVNALNSLRTVGRALHACGPGTGVDSRCSRPILLSPNLIAVAVHVSDRQDGVGKRAWQLLGADYALHSR